MAISFDMTTIDGLLNSVGSTIELFVTILALVFNNLMIFLVFCFFIGILYAFIKITDAERYMENGVSRK